MCDPLPASQLTVSDFLCNILTCCIWQNKQVPRQLLTLHFGTLETGWKLGTLGYRTACAILQLPLPLAFLLPLQKRRQHLVQGRQKSNGNMGALKAPPVLHALMMLMQFLHLTQADESYNEQSPDLWPQSQRFWLQSQGSWLQSHAQVKPPPVQKWGAEGDRELLQRRGLLALLICISIPTMLFRLLTAIP